MLMMPTSTGLKDGMKKEGPDLRPGRKWKRRFSPASMPPTCFASISRPGRHEINRDAKATQPLQKPDFPGALAVRTFMRDCPIWGLDWGTATSKKYNLLAITLLLIE